MSAFTWVHTALSVAALVSGLVVVIGLFSSKTLRCWTMFFLVTAIATSATGFGFPFQSFGASHWIGVISLLVLLAVLARYVLHYAGVWRWLYAVCAVIAFYFLVFVLIAQAFKKVPALAALAPTLSEPPFAIAQLAVLVIFVVIVHGNGPEVPPGRLTGGAPRSQAPGLSGDPRKSGAKSGANPTGGNPAITIHQSQ
jgi:hypothetical protein